MQRAQQLFRILSENTTERYSIDYQGFLFNHISHGIVALFRLGADETRMQRYVDWYKPRLENPEKEEDETVSTTVPPARMMDAQLEELRGTGKAFYSILRRYNERFEQHGSIDGFVAKTFPSLINGMMAGAKHGVIHLGYGYVAQHPRIVCEALSYIHNSYLPLSITDVEDMAIIGSGTIDILDVIDRVRKDKPLLGFVRQEMTNDEWASLETSTFQRFVRILYKHKPRELIAHAQTIQFPAFFNPETLDNTQIRRLSKWLLDCAITVYAAAVKRNDFFLLHGVTSAWSLTHILPLMGHKDALHTIRVYLCALLAVYMAQGTPAFSLDQLTPKDDQQWDEIVRDTLSEDWDEHIFKLVQVCHDISKESRGNGGLYLAAAGCALKYPLSF